MLFWLFSDQFVTLYCFGVGAPFFFFYYAIKVYSVWPSRVPTSIFWLLQRFPWCFLFRVQLTSFKNTLFPSVISGSSSFPVTSITMQLL